MRHHQGQGHWRRHRECLEEEVQVDSVQPCILTQAPSPTYLFLGRLAVLTSRALINSPKMNGSKAAVEGIASRKLCVC